jgi:hypothetical protein
MRKLVAVALVLAGCAIVAQVSPASAAGMSNASVAGTWACTTSGSVAVKDAKGGTSWVPSNGFVLATLDGSGKFSSGKTTNNVAGTACSYTFSEGTYDVNPDGSSTYTVTQKADSSNSAQCPSAATQHTSGAGTSSTFVGVSTDSGGTLSFYCIKQ